MPQTKGIEPIKHCEVCGVLMTRKKFTKKWEDMARFKARKVCSMACLAIYKTKDEPTRTAYHKRAQKLLGDRCETCGATENLDAHHKDLDITNNDPSNVATLCHSCHMKWHHASGTRPENVRKSCSICGLPAKGYGYCSKHYFRFRRHGDPNFGEPSG